MNKSTIEEIKQRFDKDVERFSNLETGQVSTIDAQISLELITEASKRIVPNAENLLDVGCGGGNYSLMILTKLANLNCSLVDLSKPMLDVAFERVSQKTNSQVTVFHGDIREVGLSENHYTWERYGDYLQTVGGKEYRQKVLDYVEKEDSPRSMNYQLDLMKQVGFRKVEILHKNMCFGAFGGIK